MDVEIDNIYVQDETNAWCGEWGKDEVKLHLNTLKGKYIGEQTSFGDPSKTTGSPSKKWDYKFSANEGHTENINKQIFPVTEANTYRYLVANEAQFINIQGYEMDNEDWLLAAEIFGAISAISYASIPLTGWYGLGAGVISTSIAVTCYYISTKAGGDPIMITELALNTQEVFDWTKGQLFERFSDETFKFDVERDKKSNMKVQVSNTPLEFGKMKQNIKFWDNDAKSTYNMRLIYTMN